MLAVASKTANGNSVDCSDEFNKRTRMQGIRACLLLHTVTELSADGKFLHVIFMIDKRTNIQAHAHLLAYM